MDGGSTRKRIFPPLPKIQLCVGPHWGPTLLSRCEKCKSQQPSSRTAFVITVTTQPGMLPGAAAHIRYGCHTERGSASEGETPFQIVFRVVLLVECTVYFGCWWAGHGFPNIESGPGGGGRHRAPFLDPPPPSPQKGSIGRPLFFAPLGAAACEGPFCTRGLHSPRPMVGRVWDRLDFGDRKVG